jgi:hypothetical protein
LLRALVRKPSVMVTGRYEAGRSAIDLAWFIVR